MKSNTYRWIIGCLIGTIIILIAYLVLQEKDVIKVSFSECLSMAATLSSLILSIIAMLYTYYSSRDINEISNQIQNTIKEVNKQVQQVSEDTRRNSELLIRVREGILDVESALKTSSLALTAIQQETFTTEKGRQSAIENIEKTQNSMIMFLNKMKNTD